MDNKIYSIFNVYIRCKGLSRDQMKLLYKSIKSNPRYGETLRSEQGFYEYPKPGFDNGDTVGYKRDKWQNIQVDNQQDRFMVSYHELLFLLSDTDRSFTLAEMFRGASKIADKLRDINFTSVPETKPDITRSNLEEVSSKIPNLEEQLTLLNQLAQKAGFEANVIFTPIIKN